MKIITTVILISLYLLSSSTEIQASDSPKKKNIVNKKIVFIGDSLTEGYGIEQKYSYPSLIGDKIENSNKKIT